MEAKKGGGSPSGGEGQGELHAEPGAGDMDEQAPGRSRGRRAAANKAWAPLMPKRTRHLDDFASDDDYTPERRHTPARSASGASRRGRGGRGGKKGGTPGGLPPANKATGMPHPEVSMMNSANEEPKKAVQIREVDRFSASKAEALGGGGESGSDGDELMFNLDEDFDDDEPEFDPAVRRPMPVMSMAARGSRGAVRGAAPTRGMLQREVKVKRAVRPSVATGGSGMLTGKVPDISQATALIRKSITSQIRPREDPPPPVKVLRMTSSSPGTQQKFTLMRNSAGQLCRVMRAIPSNAPSGSASVRVPFPVSSSVQRAPAAPPNDELNPEIREKMATRVVAGSSVAEFNRLIDFLSAELTRVVEDRKRLTLTHQELVDQMQLGHATVVDIKDSRIRHLEHQVDILQAKLQAQLRNQQALLLANESSSAPGDSGAVERRVVKIEMNGAGSSNPNAMSMKQEEKEMRSSILPTERVGGDEGRELKDEADEDCSDEEMIEEEGEEDFDELA